MNQVKLLGNKKAAIESCFDVPVEIVLKGRGIPISESYHNPNSISNTLSIAVITKRTLDIDVYSRFKITVLGMVEGFKSILTMNRMKGCSDSGDRHSMRTGTRLKRHVHAKRTRLSVYKYNFYILIY